LIACDELRLTEQIESMKRIIALLIFLPLIQAQTASGPPPQPPQSLADWQKMIPAVRVALKAQFRDDRIEEPYSVGILRASHVADITGDGVSEALVFFGIGGASTSQLTLMQMENGNPVVSLFKDRAGAVSPMVFLEGGSVMHTDAVDLLSREHTVYSIHYNYGSNGKLHQCGGEAYTWDQHSKRFDYNSALTKKLTKTTCRKVPQTVG
jgi:hypothetical protein